ncbi:ComEA family DNA-binding protein [Papillibacter cinnamivorans]|uniref:Competence protein ComEA n=1 Tax=Papillibacter cinnamivorans DSM 12816 TaxID=1122930 RepID=A0A1W2AAQ3_9FIRM|nr:ComEA family DNA-binding protein [Papillibacter cinnamivorans]SMC57724.1 competence protein ComEA [Papillibacter cinnamivorans DSM 12816]
MKRSTFFLAAAGLTIAFFAFTAGYYFGQSSMGRTISVSTQYSEPAAVSTGTVSASPEDAIVSETPASGAPAAEAPGSETSRQTAAIEKKIDINTASRADLETLPGIGEVLAGRIVDYREQNGDFRTIYDITNVKGIGEKTLEKIEDLITTG